MFKNFVVYGYNELHFNNFLQGHGEGFKKDALTLSDKKDIKRIIQEVKGNIANKNKLLNMKSARVLVKENVPVVELSTKGYIALMNMIITYKKSIVVASKPGVLKRSSSLPSRNYFSLAVEDNMRHYSDIATPSKKTYSAKSPTIRNSINVSGENNVSKSNSKGTNAIPMSMPRPTIRPPSRAMRLISSQSSNAYSARRTRAGNCKRGGAITLQPQAQQYIYEVLTTLFLIDAYHDFESKKDPDFTNHIKGKVSQFFTTASHYLKQDILQYFTGTQIPTHRTLENLIFDNVLLHRVLGNVIELQPNIYFIASTNTPGDLVNSAPACNVLGTQMDPKPFFEFNLGFLHKSVINDVFPNTKLPEKFKEKFKAYYNDVKTFISSEVVYDPLKTSDSDVNKFMTNITNDYNFNGAKMLLRLSTHTQKIFNDTSIMNEYMSGFNNNTKLIFNIVYYYNEKRKTVSVALLFKSLDIAKAIFDATSYAGQRTSRNDDSTLPLIFLNKFDVPPQNGDKERSLNEKNVMIMKDDTSAIRRTQFKIGIDIMMNYNERSLFAINTILKIKKLIQGVKVENSTLIEKYIAEYIKKCVPDKNDIFELLLDLKKAGDAGKVLIAYYMNEDLENTEKIVYVSNDTLAGLHTILRLNTDVITGYNPQNPNAQNLISSRQILVYTARDIKISSYFDYFIHKMSHTFNISNGYSHFNQAGYQYDIFKNREICDNYLFLWLINEDTQLQSGQKLYKSCLLFEVLRIRLDEDFKIDIQEVHGQVPGALLHDILHLNLNELIYHLYKTYLEAAINNIKFMAQNDNPENPQYKVQYTECTKGFYDANATIVNFFIYNISETNNDVYKLLKIINDNLISAGPSKHKKTRNTKVNYIGTEKENDVLITATFNRFSISEIDASHYGSSTKDRRCARHDYNAEYLFKSLIDIRKANNEKVTYSDLFNFFDMYKKFYEYYNQYFTNNNIFSTRTDTLTKFKILYDELLIKFINIHKKLKIIDSILDGYYSDIALLNIKVKKIRDECGNDYIYIIDTLRLKIKSFIQEYDILGIVASQGFNFNQPA